MGEARVIALFRGREAKGIDSLNPKRIYDLIGSEDYSIKYGYQIERFDDNHVLLGFYGLSALKNFYEFITHMQNVIGAALAAQGKQDSPVVVICAFANSSMHNQMQQLLTGNSTEQFGRFIDSCGGVVFEKSLFEKTLGKFAHSGEERSFRAASDGFAAIVIPLSKVYRIVEGADSTSTHTDKIENGLRTEEIDEYKVVFHEGVGRVMNTSDKEKTRKPQKDGLEEIPDSHADIRPPDTSVWNNASKEFAKIWEDLDSLVPNQTAEHSSTSKINRTVGDKSKSQQAASQEFVSGRERLSQSENERGWQRQTQRQRSADAGRMEVIPPDPETKDSTTRRFIRELLSALQQDNIKQEVTRTNFDTSREVPIRREITRPSMQVQGDPLSPYIDPEVRKRKASSQQVEPQEGKGLAFIIILALLGILIVALLWKFYTY